jgi:hypothetical protein
MNTNRFDRHGVTSIAALTAFMYAGALEHPIKGLKHGADFENWEGHTGFVFYCGEYAIAIEQWLTTPERIDDEHDGVMLYELIEPMGEWLIGQDGPLDTDVVLQHFKTEYLAWINKD